PQGWWKGELETNVTMEAEDLLLRQFLGIRGAEETERTARWIRSRQRADGTWATFEGGPADLSTTVEAYVALRLDGDRPDAPHMARAAAYVREQGGLARTRVFTRIWLALFGRWSWDDLPAMPPELVLLPPSVPLNLYDWGCWARQTAVPLTIVSALRPARPLGVGLDELRNAAPPPPAAPLVSWEGAFGRLDRLLRPYHRRPPGVLRRHALRRAAEWIVARQEADGCWGGIQPPWVYSLIALHLLGYPLDHPVLAAGLAGLERFTVRERTPDGPVRRLEACQSPVWDTALAVIALSDAGVPGDAPAMRGAVRWLLGEQILVRGDWAVRRPALPPGGWAFEFDNDGYPDVDDTAEVVLALRRAAADDPQVAAAVERGVTWSAGMQSRDGGWAAFDADNTGRAVTRLPFCDFGEVIDPPSADVTAHMVEMLADVGRADGVAARRGVAWLLAAQEPDGSWYGRWGVNHVYGTGAVVPALLAAGVSPRDPAVRRAVRWLERHQAPDGGWGEDIRSYRDPSWVGRGTPTASQTAWALLALLAADPASPAVDRGVRFLVDTQRPDGTWDEPTYTGTGFPGDFSINYHLYRLVFPLSALGRYLRGGP
ncbi:MAG TPA: squalene--hopene cyclase, partial [Frankiaceae bacterium]|nr:squalene--hopene cyclase [Frankiaceae bacterium]